MESDGYAPAYIEKFKKFVAVVMVSAVIFCICIVGIPQLLWIEEPLAPVREADPEIVNGILTIASIIFALHSVLFKIPNKYVRVFWIASVTIQSIILASVGFLYVNDALVYGFPTTNTLRSAYGALGAVLLFVTLSALVEVAIHFDWM